MIPWSYVIIGLVFTTLVVVLLPMTMGFIIIPVALFLVIAAFIAVIFGAWKTVMALGSELWIGVVLTLHILLDAFNFATTAIFAPIFASTIGFIRGYHLVLSIVSPFLTFLCVSAVWRLADLTVQHLSASEKSAPMMRKLAFITAAFCATAIFNLMGIFTHNNMVTFGFLAITVSVGIVVSIWRMVLAVSKEVWIGLFVTLGMSFWVYSSAYSLLGTARHRLIDALVIWGQPVVMALSAAALWRLAGLVKVAATRNRIGAAA